MVCDLFVKGCMGKEWGGGGVGLVMGADAATAAVDRYVRANIAGLHVVRSIWETCPFWSCTLPLSSCRGSIDHLPNRLLARMLLLPPFR